MNKLCNVCGKKKRFDDTESMDEVVEANLFSNIEIRFGYGSEFDMTSMGFCICEDCLKTMIATFKHAPTRKDLNFG